MPHLPTNPAHLGRAASATVEPDFTGPDWFEAYTARHAADGQEGRLVSQFAFSESWDSWEMHPHGAELVICTQGACTLHQEHADGSTETVALAPGDYAINPPGTWHTADVASGERCTAMSITPALPHFTSRAEPPRPASATRHPAAIRPLAIASPAQSAHIGAAEVANRWSLVLCGSVFLPSLP